MAGEHYQLFVRGRPAHHRGALVRPSFLQGQTMNTKPRFGCCGLHPQIVRRGAGAGLQLAPCAA